jgi:3-deoxy-D-manno-octulosonic-acid transferase
MRCLYNMISWLILPFAFIRLYLRGRKAPAYRLRWKERLGYAPFELSHCIWVHAVSLGETIAATALIKQLQQRYPTQPILVTNMTPTGSAQAQKMFGNTVHNCYLPYDVPSCLKRFLKRVNPAMLIIMETELWPNLMHYTAQRKIPIILANARLSARSAKGYGRFKKTTTRLLNHFTMIAAQHQDDGDRYLALGLAPEKLVVTGSIKFDITPAADREQKAQALKNSWGNRPVWIAGSTHETEEEKVLLAHRTVLQQYPNALLILVPRHPERFPTAKALCEQQGFTIITRSSGKPCTPETQVYLGDTMGELMVLYALSDVAFVGGSFITLGGHNLLEPAALAKPGLTGPNFFNFMDITKKLIAADAVFQVNSSDELAQRILQLFKDGDLRQRMGKNGLDLVMKNRGALAKLCGVIEKTMPSS